MRTARLLTVSQHALPGGVPARGVPAWGGYCPGGVPAGGVGVPVGGCTCPGGVPAEVLPPWTESQTRVKT